MTSDFSLSRIRSAYLKMLGESESPQSSSESSSSTQTPEKPRPYRMTDEERYKFHKDEIKRIKRLQDHYNSQKRYQRGQGYAVGALKTTLERYQKAVDDYERKQAASTQYAGAGGPSPSQSTQNPKDASKPVEN